jgi:hypothetical protein
MGFDSIPYWVYIPIHPVPLLRGGSRSSLVAGRDAVDATGRSKAGMREKREPDDDSAPRGRREACLSRRSCPRQNMSGRPRRSGSSSRRVVVAAVSVSPANGGNPDRSPGAARRTPSLLTACGTPDVSGAFVVANSCAFLFCTRGCGCVTHPAFRAPSVWRAGMRVFRRPPRRKEQG